MPMNAPVMETTGTDLVPTSYICGRTFLMSFNLVKTGPRLRKVRPTKIQKSPNAAKMLVVVRPTCSMKETGMAGNDSGTVHQGHERERSTKCTKFTKGLFHFAGRVVAGKRWICWY